MQPRYLTMLSHDEIMQHTELLTLLGAYEHENVNALQMQIINLIKKLIPSFLLN